MRRDYGIEKQANDFALNLLLPEKDVRAAVDAGEKNVGKLADKFGVTARVMKERLVDLGYTFNLNNYALTSFQRLSRRADLTN